MSTNSVAFVLRQDCLAVLPDLRVCHEHMELEQLACTAHFGPELISMRTPHMRVQPTPMHILRIYISVHIRYTGAESSTDDAVSPSVAVAEVRSDLSDAEKRKAELAALSLSGTVSGVPTRAPAKYDL